MAEYLLGHREVQIDFALVFPDVHRNDGDVVANLKAVPQRFKNVGLASTVIAAKADETSCCFAPHAMGQIGHIGDNALLARKEGHFASPWRRYPMRKPEEKQKAASRLPASENKEQKGNDDDLASNDD